MRAHEEAVRRGIRLLNRLFRKRWLKWVDLERLDMVDPGPIADELGYQCGCVGAQIAAHSTRGEPLSKERWWRGTYDDFRERILPEEVVNNTDEYGFTTESLRYPGLTREWKRQIRELRGGS